MLNPLMRFFKFYVLKRGFREGLAGFIVAWIEASYTFLKYAKLWELQLRDKQPAPLTVATPVTSAKGRRFERPPAAPADPPPAPASTAACRNSGRSS